MTTGWSESGKVTLQVIIAVFLGPVEKFFDQRWLTPLEKNIGLYATTPIMLTVPENEEFHFLFCG